VTTAEPFTDPPAGRAVRLRERYAEVTGALRGVLDLVAHDTTVQFSTADQVWVPEPVAGRIVLVGDAAHAAAPNMAQGASMAAEDALVLAEELGRPGAAGDGYRGALARYAARRAPRARHVQETTALRSRLGNLLLSVRLPHPANFAELSRNSFAALLPEP
jgi:2-polyprenyl-6-methoxyphenol hydroxylase-like FAD-dependent oxidoreductase